MSTTLTNGLKLPDKGSVDWYADMQNNYAILDGAIGTVAEHTTAIAGKAPAVHTHTKSDITDLFNSANTWTGDNTFSGSNSFNSGLTINNAALLNAVLQNAVKGDVSTTGDFAIFIKDKVNGNAATSLLAVYRGGQDSGGSYAQINIDTKGNDNSRYNNSILFRINPADNSNNAVLIPQRDKTIELGTSSNKWKSLNGLNPGALSIPDGADSGANSSFTPDTTDWPKDGTEFQAIMPIVGWLRITIKNVAGNYAFVRRGKAGVNQSWLIFADPTFATDFAEVTLNVPVTNGTYTLRINSPGGFTAKVYPCLGNV